MYLVEHCSFILFLIEKHLICSILFGLDFSLNITKYFLSLETHSLIIFDLDWFFKNVILWILQCFWFIFCELLRFYYISLIYFSFGCISLIDSLFLGKVELTNIMSWTSLKYGRYISNYRIIHPNNFLY